VKGKGSSKSKHTVVLCELVSRDLPENGCLNDM